MSRLYEFAIKGKLLIPADDAAEAGKVNATIGKRLQDALEEITRDQSLPALVATVAPSDKPHVFTPDERTLQRMAQQQTIV